METPVRCGFGGPGDSLPVQLEAHLKIGRSKCLAVWRVANLATYDIIMESLNEKHLEVRNTAVLA